MTDETVSISELGEPVEQVVLEIDYQIIEHFSRHLYGSTNKAIEELVANGFDAYAQKVFVYLPGRFTRDYVAVWDDGWSMGVEGLKDLWLIASSPKEKQQRVANGPRGQRKMIGKFGIGKLASYSIGNTITHLCRVQEEFFSVSVDYRDIHPDEGGNAVTTRNPLRAPIRKLTIEQARKFVEEVFDISNMGEAWKIFDGDSWTLAVVGALKTTEIPHGRLMWVLGNGMPLRPDFKVWVNDERVGPRLEKDAIEEWNFGNTHIQDSLKTNWRKAVARGDVDGDAEFGSEQGLDPAHVKLKIPYIYLPQLGWIWGTIRLFDRSLVDGRAVEHGRSHGFFVMVRGRLLNTDDPELFLKPPSYGTFYRAQFILNVDGLDDELLADRSRLQQDTAKASELSVLQHALYMAARTFLENRDIQKSEEEKHLATLPTRSREFYREPVTALMMKSGLPVPMSFNISKPRVERQPLGEDKPLASLSPTGDGFLVNVSHPYFRVLESRLGNSRKAKELLRVFDLFAVSELLLEGHLYDLGLSGEQVSEVTKWREGLFRELAKAYEAAPSDLAMQLVNSSYIGGKPFENVLAAVLESMGFSAERRGASGKEDVFLLATIGPDTYKLIFEAKGSKGKLANDAAEVGGAVAHREKVGADWAVIVAREFAGFGSSGGNEPAILNECRAAKGVSIMTVEALNQLARAVDEFGYPLDLLRDVFMAVESPAAKLERIQRLQSPTQDFDYRKLLERIWQEQRGQALGDVVSYRPIWQAEWKSEMTFEEFEGKIIALETLAGGRIRVSQSPREISILQSPDLLTEAIESTLRGYGSSYRNK